jgi:hypothetical protein
MLSAAALCFAACGGGGDGRSGAGEPPPPAPDPSGDPSGDPFGLTERTPLAAFDLPTGAGTLGTYELVNGFPNLSFASAAYLAGVPGEDRLVVMEQAGRLRVFDNDPQATTAMVLLDISSDVLFAGDQGLRGLAGDRALVSKRMGCLD